ncbi:DUF2510 domain-containing protein [Nakamurella sp.]|uniref:DUF2510 domain-containing protein n=1 Tax=Nakamurella sp. TaxID=1869182 RepID=UPI003784AD41
MTANYSERPPTVEPGTDRAVAPGVGPAPAPGVGATTASAPAAGPAPGTAPVGSTRPGSVRAIAVLGFVQAGFNAIGALMSFQGAGQLAEFGLRRTAVGSSLTVLALLGLASAALLIVGGLVVLRGKALAITVGASASILLSVWWAIEFDYVRQLQMMALMMAALPVVMLGLLFGTAARAWVRFDLPAARPAAGPAAPGLVAPGSVPAAPAAMPIRVPSGWHADPAGRHEVRYWDGTAWTPHVADRGVAGQDQL